MTEHNAANNRNGTEYDHDREAWLSYLHDAPCNHDHLSEDFAWDCYMERGTELVYGQPAHKAEG